MKTLNKPETPHHGAGIPHPAEQRRSFEAIAADYPALTADDLEAIHVQLTEKEAQSNG